ncbi:MAG: hypothetical protein ABIP75_02495, partial [Pyrinomonadaceae bacterium]
PTRTAGGIASIPESQGNNGLRLYIPQASWEPMLFGPINESVRQANLADLRSGSLPDLDLEVRVWICSGTKPVHGFVLTKVKGRDSAIYLGLVPGTSYFVKNPANGTRQLYDLWADLTKQEILSLPDASQLRGAITENTGESYVFETNSEGVYRTYRYTSQVARKSKETEQVRTIVSLLCAQFGIAQLQSLESDAGN